MAAPAVIIEAAAECDDDLFLKYFEAPETISEADVLIALRKGTLRGQFCPVLCGTAYRNSGVQPLIDALIDALEKQSGDFKIFDVDRPNACRKD